MIDGSSVVSGHPNIKALDCFRGGRLQIYYDLDDQTAPLRELYVKVMKDDLEVGRANFSDDEYSTHCQNAQVIPEYQKQGIGSGMYVFAELVLKKTLCDFWKGNPIQTEAARRMWASPNRPFGHHDDVT